ncbi:unnamed protein product [Closterium sp. NIES-65]|nr:unnamed protein product [Closterium sp. NIES-65]
MPYEPLPSLFPITLEEAEEEEEVVAPPAMPYVPTSVPTPPPPSPVGEGGMEVPPSVEITDGQRLETEQLQDESSMDGVQQTGEQQIGEQQTGKQQSGEQQIGEERIEEQQMVDQQLGEQQTCTGRACKGGSVKVRAIGQAGENFNLDTPAWNKLVGGQGGQVEVTYDQVDCSSSGGMAVRLLPDASKYNFALQIFGAARRGRVKKVEISKDGKEWKSMTNNGWGATWVLNPATGVVDAGRAVSVRVSGSGKQVVLDGVIPSKWSGGKIYQSSKNF